MVLLPPPAQPTVDAIYAAYVATQKPSRTGYGINASEIGTECDRKLWYKLRWSTEPKQHDDGRVLRVFERGNIEEERIIQNLRDAGITVQDVDPETGKQWAFEIADGWVRGRADGIAWGFPEAPKAKHVIEIKSMKAADWRAVKKHGLLAKKPDHWHQLHSGMYGLGISRGMYIGTNKDTEEILTERIKLDPDVAARQEARVLGIVKSYSTPPPRISEKPDSFLCRFCDFREICHSDAFAPRHCRSCLSFSFRTGPDGYCERFDDARDVTQQQECKNCPAHRFLPGLVPGEQVDAADDLSWLEYKLKDGQVWRDE